jgi:hypothetical protein
MFGWIEVYGRDYSRMSSFCAVPYFWFHSIPASILPLPLPPHPHYLSLCIGGIDRISQERVVCVIPGRIGGCIVLFHVNIELSVCLCVKDGGGGEVSFKLYNTRDIDRHLSTHHVLHITRTCGWILCIYMISPNFFRLLQYRGSDRSGSCVSIQYPFLCRRVWRCGVDRSTFIVRNT